ncbi:MAG: hypothetical protein IJF34_00540 [Clostridia bacterium]|nr:hypothetical protein [Clostridia bacterium]
MNQEEKIRQAIEEERQRAVLESLEMNHKRSYSDEEMKRYRKVMEEIRQEKTKLEELDAIHRQKRKAYQERLKKENIKPLMHGIYFVLSGFIFFNVLLIIVYKGIFDQTPILQYLWLICIILMAIGIAVEHGFLKYSEKKREPMKREILNLQSEISLHTQKLKELEANRDNI